MAAPAHAAPFPRDAHCLGLLRAATLGAVTVAAGSALRPCCSPPSPAPGRYPRGAAGPGLRCQMGPCWRPPTSELSILGAMLPRSPPPFETPPTAAAVGSAAHMVRPAPASPTGSRGTETDTTSPACREVEPPGAPAPAGSCSFPAGRQAGLGREPGSGARPVTRSEVTEEGDKRLLFGLATCLSLFPRDQCWVPCS